MDPDDVKVARIRDIYLSKEASLEALAGACLESMKGHVNNFVHDALVGSRTAEVDVFSYRVPVSLEDGACSASKDLDPTPFDLASFLSISSDASLRSRASESLSRLYWLVGQLMTRTRVDWLGVYALVRPASPAEPFLVKLAYSGRPSRAIFPLNDLYKSISNNSWSTMEGKPRLIQAVRTYDGPYYACDANVNSELCVPLLDSEGRVVGLVDAEAFGENHFTPERVVEILAACSDLGLAHEAFFKPINIHNSSIQTHEKP